MKVKTIISLIIVVVVAIVAYFLVDNYFLEDNFKAKSDKEIRDERAQDKQSIEDVEKLKQEREETIKYLDTLDKAFPKSDIVDKEIFDRIAKHIKNPYFKDKEILVVLKNRIISLTKENRELKGRLKKALIREKKLEAINKKFYVSKEKLHDDYIALKKAKRKKKIWEVYLRGGATVKWNPPDTHTKVSGEGMVGVKVYPQFLYDNYAFYVETGYSDGVKVGIGIYIGF